SPSRRRPRSRGPLSRWPDPRPRHTGLRGVGERQRPPRPRARSRSSLWQRCVLLGPIDIGLREWFADHRKARHELLEPDSRGPLLHPFVPNAAVELVRVVLAPIPEDDRTRRECVDFEQKRYELLKAGLAQRVSIPNEHTAVRRGGNLAGQTLPHE